MSEQSAAVHTPLRTAVRDALDRHGDGYGPHMGRVRNILCFRGPKGTCAHFTLTEAAAGFRRGKAYQRAERRAARPGPTAVDARRVSAW